MVDGAIVTNIRFTPAPAGAGNLVGFVRCTIGHLRLDLMLVRTGKGLRVIFPKRTDRHGGRHQVVRPVNERTRAAIESAILGSLGWSKAS